MPREKIGFRRRLTVLGILIIGQFAAFILGILSLKRTQEIVSDDFQPQQLILGKSTARQSEDGVGGSTGTTFFVDLQPENAAAPAPEARGAVN
jgi:hypothetical protein